MIIPPLAILGVAASKWIYSKAKKISSRLLYKFKKSISREKTKANSEKNANNLQKTVNKTKPRHLQIKERKAKRKAKNKAKKRRKRDKKSNLTEDQIRTIQELDVLSQKYKSAQNKGESGKPLIEKLKSEDPKKEDPRKEDIKKEDQKKEITVSNEVKKEETDSEIPLKDIGSNNETKKENLFEHIVFSEIDIDKINNEFLLVISKRGQSELTLNKINITKQLDYEFKHIKNLCFSKESNIEEITEYIGNNEALLKTNGKYSYCETFHKAYQNELNINFFEYSKKIKTELEVIKINYENDQNILNFKKSIQCLKSNICSDLDLWMKAISIDKAYIKCKTNSDVIIFSHRIIGWSNPIYQLTSNFSVEIKTNFGYGKSSYFLTKLKYKNIEITPFSEWIEYEYAKFNEIIRYTKKHRIENKSWSEAINFCLESCNLSLKDEKIFVEKYIILECEKMVTGLEKILNSSEFSFKNEANRIYSMNKSGSDLIEFRGEKITGGIDFISKIQEFIDIEDMSQFIDRIENCNNELLPLLENEVPILEAKLIELNIELTKIKPHYDSLSLKKKKYDLELKKITDSIKSNPNIFKYSDPLIIFNTEFPEYFEFEITHRKVTQEYVDLEIKYSKTKNTLARILGYIEKIGAYFLPF